MTEKLTIACAQINLVVGDVPGNVDAIADWTRRAAAQGADLIIFPEMAITGYPPEDLVFKRSFQQAAMRAVEELAKELADCPTAVLVGGLWREGDAVYNATFLIEGGACVHRQFKRSLPNYGVFDEKRLFAKGERAEPVMWRGVSLGILICEDVWDERGPRQLKKHGAELLIVQNASPYEMGKARRRKHVVDMAASQNNLPVIYLNLVGGQDELVFDGRSFAAHPDGADVMKLAAFDAELGITQWEKQPKGWRCVQAPMEATPDDCETIYQAMVLGLRDYVNKNGFKGVVIGISGGIDSGLSAAVAVDALGAERVRGLLMPSRYTSDESVEDARDLAQRLGFRLDMIGIEPAMAAFDGMLREVFAGLKADTTEENIQARIRGNLLMAMSNKLGFMVLTTGNKSEMSVGYATLYGDMCGGYSVLKDVYKTTVYKLSWWRNQCSEFRVQRSGSEGQQTPSLVLPLEGGGRGGGGAPLILAGPAGEVIPQRMITKAPTAELKANQKDQDTLPPYELLDAMLMGLVEQRLSVDELVDQGFDRAVANQVARMVYVAEYKRRQSPPGVKVSGMAFGRDRRYPITNRWI